MPENLNQLPRVRVHDLGLIDFKKSWEYQESLLREIVQVKLANRDGKRRDPVPGYLLFCEHPPVYTLGKSGTPRNLLIGQSELDKQGVGFYRINRGGDITYHGPGQVVAYPVIDLDQYFNDIHRYMRCLEEVVIRTIAGFGLSGSRIEKATGVWMHASASGIPAKICAFGVRCSRWVTMHGLALNVNTNLRYFDNIVPCGIADKSVTSMQKELGRLVNMRKVKDSLARNFSEVFNATLVEEQGQMI